MPRHSGRQEIVARETEEGWVRGKGREEWRDGGGEGEGREGEKGRREGWREVKMNE